MGLRRTRLGRSDSRLRGLLRLSAILDTHTFLWFAADDGRLSRAARSYIESRKERLLLSAVSVFEIAVKHSKGRLPLPAEINDYISLRAALYDLEELSVDFAHALQVAALPPHHRDPFDRLLIAQAQVEGLPILTNDPNIRRYDVEIIW